MKFTKLLVAAGIALSALGAQAQTNLVTNGSFEQIVKSTPTGQNDGTWKIYNKIVGWTGQPNIEVRDNVAGTAQLGSNFVELDTKMSTGGNSAMFQNISIATAGEYLLSFWYSARPGTAASTNGLSYSFGSFTGNVAPGTGIGFTDNVWHQEIRKVFLAGDTILTFAATGRTDSYGSSLDNVSVTAVPEVETYAMMLAGLGLMGSIARRRKAKNA